MDEHEQETAPVVGEVQSPPQEQEHQEGMDGACVVCRSVWICGVLVWVCVIRP